MTVLDYMRTIDPTYGAEHHQRAFIHRMDRAQQLAPCTKDHVGERPPCHTTKCYPLDARGQMVGTDG